MHWRDGPWPRFLYSKCCNLYSFVGKVIHVWMFSDKMIYIWTLLRFNFRLDRMLFIDILQGCNVFDSTCNEYLNNNSFLDYWCAEITLFGQRFLWYAIYRKQYNMIWVMVFELWQAVVHRYIGSTIIRLTLVVFSSNPGRGFSTVQDSTIS